MSCSEKVLEWSSHLTTESQKFDLESYYWTKPIKNASWTILSEKGQLLGIKGLQGTGKSAAIEALINSLPEGVRTFFYKWKRNWEERFLEDEIPAWNEYWLAIWRRLLQKPDLIQRKLKIAPEWISGMLVIYKEQKTADLRYKARKPIDDVAPIEALEAVLGKDTLNEIKHNLFNNFLRTATHIFIDLPDYSKNNIQSLNKDVDELQHMWQEFNDRNLNMNFIISAQQEIIMKKPHYFFGKFNEWFEIKPLTPDQLLEAYSQKWKSFEPFNEDSLRLIAKLSRGVFRRFLKYIHLTVREFITSGKVGEIKVEDVQKVISFDVLNEDLELELSDIFPNTQQRIQAVKVLDILRNESLTQKIIAERICMSEAVTGKLIAKLELYGYVKRTRSKEEGFGWIVSLFSLGQNPQILT